MFYRLAAQQKTIITPAVLRVESSTPSVLVNADACRSVAFSTAITFGLRNQYSGGYNISDFAELAGQIGSIVDTGTSTRYLAGATGYDGTTTSMAITGWDTSAGSPLTTFDAHVMDIRARHQTTPNSTEMFDVLSSVYGTRIIPFTTDTAGVVTVGQKYIALSSFILGQSVYTFRRLSMGATPIVILNSTDTSAYKTSAVANVSTTGFSTISRDFGGSAASTGFNGFIVYRERRDGYAGHESPVLTPYRDATLFYVPITNNGVTAAARGAYANYFTVSRISTGVVDVTFKAAIPATSGLTSAISIAMANSSTGPLFTSQQQSGTVGKIRVSAWSRTAGTAIDADFFLAVLFFRDKTAY